MVQGGCRFVEKLVPIKDRDSRPRWPLAFDDGVLNHRTQHAPRLTAPCAGRNVEAKSRDFGLLPEALTAQLHCRINC
jgi:hypothetical protein